MTKRHSVKRDYRAAIQSLMQVWKIEHVPSDEALWRLGEAEMTTLPNRGLRIAVWNLCKGVGGILFEHDYRSLCYRSDIVLTQEALLSQHSMRMFCERGFHAEHAASYKRRDGLRDGVMTVSRAMPLPDGSQRIVCKYPEPILKTPKSALVQTYVWGEEHQRLLVINVHATLIRRKSAAIEEIEHLIQKIPAHEGPILLAGDFNTFTPGYLQAVASVLQKVGLEYVPIVDDPRPKSQALDQVFVRGAVVKSIAVDTTVRNSDHFPILMEILPQKPKM